MDTANPVDFWMVNTGEGYLCPDLVSIHLLSPIDYGNPSTTVDLDTALFIGENPPPFMDDTEFYPPGGTFNVAFTVPAGGDPNYHQSYIEASGSIPDLLTIEIVDSIISISGPPPWITVSGTIEPDGSISTSGSGDAAGRSNVAVALNGYLVSGDLNGEYEMGLNGQLPGGTITYTVEGQQVPGTIEISNETIVNESTNPNTGITTLQVDLDGDGLADVVRTEMNTAG